MAIGEIGKMAAQRLKGYAKATRDDARHLGNFYSDKASKVADFGMNRLVKETDPTFLNAYTGLAPTKAATGLFTAGAAGYGAYSTIKGEYRGRIENGQHDYLGQAPIMTGDGVGNKSNAPTLGANGSLVFGLHNQR